jgi:hypothetical protein
MSPCGVKATAFTRLICYVSGGAIQGVAHRDATRVAEQLVVVRERRIRRVHDRRGPREVRPEPFRPALARRHNRYLFELVGVERQHHLESDTGVEDRLRDQDVGAGRERAERESDTSTGQERADLVVDVSFERRGEPTDYLAPSMRCPQ